VRVQLAVAAIFAVGAVFGLFVGFALARLTGPTPKSAPKSD
jgi:hypothetical protein